MHIWVDIISVHVLLRLTRPEAEASGQKAETSCHRSTAGCNTVVMRQIASSLSAASSAGTQQGGLSPRADDESTIQAIFTLTSC